VQAPAAGTPAVQLFTAIKLPGGFTVAAPMLKIAAPAPRLLIVTVTSGDAVPDSAPPKLVVPVGEIVSVACTAVPFTASICGLFGALSESITTAERAPVCAGSTVTFMTPDLSPARGLCEQSSVSAKSPGFVPTTLMVIATGVVPVLLTVTGCAALLAPTVCDAKFNGGGDRELPGVPPVPLSATLCRLPVALSLSAAPSGSLSDNATHED
jgi:hypothetical protein